MCVCVLLLLLLNITSSSLLYLFFTCFALLLPFLYSDNDIFVSFHHLCVCVWFSFLITTFGYFFCLFFILNAAVKHARAFTMFFFLSVFCVCVKLSVLPFHSLFSFFLFVFSSFFGI